MATSSLLATAGAMLELHVDVDEVAGMDETKRAEPELKTASERPHTAEFDLSVVTAAGGGWRYVSTIRSLRVCVLGGVGMADYGTLLRDHVTLSCRSVDRIFGPPPEPGHRGYEATVDGSCRVRPWRCAHSMGGMNPSVECSRFSWGPGRRASDFDLLDWPSRPSKGRHVHDTCCTVVCSAAEHCRYRREASLHGQLSGSLACTTPQE